MIASNMFKFFPPGDIYLMHVKYNQNLGKMNLFLGWTDGEAERKKGEGKGGGYCVENELS